MKKLFFCILPIITACGSSKQYDSAQPTPSNSIGELKEFKIALYEEIKEKKAEQLNSPPPDHCAKDMAFIKGEYCEKINQKCLRWLDNPNLQYARCAKYDIATCMSSKTHKEYCIDKEELHDTNGLSLGDQSWTMCKALCENQNKRLCVENEWTFACRGEEMHAYPYGSGYDFDTTSCNVERHPISCGKDVCDYRANISEFSGCVSLFGVHNMIGNEDEWINVPRYSSSGMTMRSALVGGHFFGGRHRPGVKTVGHDESFHQITTGCRCCSDSE